MASGCGSHEHREYEDQRSYPLFHHFSLSMAALIPYPPVLSCLSPAFVTRLNPRQWVPPAVARILLGKLGRHEQFLDADLELERGSGDIVGRPCPDPRCGALRGTSVRPAHAAAERALIRRSRLR